MEGPACFLKFDWQEIRENWRLIITRFTFFVYSRLFNWSSVFCKWNFRKRVVQVPTVKNLVVCPREILRRTVSVSNKKASNDKVNNGEIWNKRWQRIFNRVGIVEEKVVLKTVKNVVVGPGEILIRRTVSVSNKKTSNEKVDTAVRYGTWGDSELLPDWV